MSHDVTQLEGDRISLSALQNGNGELPILLIVEDNRDLISYLVSSIGTKFKLELAYDGEEGIAKATQIIPDLIISDVMMPKKDGFQFCNEVKQHPLTSHIPLILLTAKADHNSKMVGLSKGADAYLSKPFYIDELMIRINGLIEQRKRIQEFYRKETGIYELNGPNNSFSKIESSESKFLNKVVQIIEEKLDDPDLTVDSLSREMFMSNSNLYRKLNALINLSPNKLIRLKRLKKARQLLKDQTHSISDVAIDVGFQSPEYFSRTFKKEFGISPSEYRNKA